MASPCEVLVRTREESSARALLEAVANEAWRIEDRFSRYLPGNIVATINDSNGRPVTVDDETANLLDFAQSLYELSDGRFDITSGALRRAWTFDGSDRLPTEDAVAAIVATIGWHKANWQRPRLSLEPGMLATLAMLNGADAEAFLDGQGVQYWCRRSAQP